MRQKKSNTQEEQEIAEYEREISISIPYHEIDEAMVRFYSNVIGNGHPSVCLCHVCAPYEDDYSRMDEINRCRELPEQERELIDWLVILNAAVDDIKRYRKWASDKEYAQRQIEESKAEKKHVLAWFKNNGIMLVKNKGVYDLPVYGPDYAPMYMALLSGEDESYEHPF